jgi:CTP synthase (UTP-ammonia lyase)
MYVCMYVCVCVRVHDVDNIYQVPVLLAEQGVHNALRCVCPCVRVCMHVCVYECTYVPYVCMYVGT